MPDDHTPLTEGDKAILTAEQGTDTPSTTEQEQ